MSAGIRAIAWEKESGNVQGLTFTTELGRGIPSGKKRAFWGNLQERRTAIERKAGAGP